MAPPLGAKVPAGHVAAWLEATLAPSRVAGCPASARAPPSLVAKAGVGMAAARAARSALAEPGAPSVAVTSRAVVCSWRRAVVGALYTSAPVLALVAAVMRAVQRGQVRDTAEVRAVEMAVMPAGVSVPSGAKAEAPMPVRVRMAVNGGAGGAGDCESVAVPVAVAVEEEVAVVVALAVAVAEAVAVAVAEAVAVAVADAVSLERAVALELEATAEVFVLVAIEGA